jgi:hypothetical protein
MESRKHYVRYGVMAAVVGALLLLAAGCSGAGGGGSASDGGGESEAPPAEAPGSSDDAFREGDGAVAPGEEGAPAVKGDPALQGLLDRKIVQTTSVDLEVEEVGRNFQDIVRIADGAGGFVASSTFSNDDDEQIADVTIRVPGDEYQRVLAEIRGMGEVAQESSDANDVTEEYTDLQARLRTLQATEQRYIELLAQAQNINDILVVQDRLDSVRGQIEQVQGRINVLDHLTELATITVHLRPLSVAVDGGGTVGPIEAAQNAWEASLDSVRAVATVVVAVVAYSWWLVLGFGAIALGARWWSARRPGAAGA